MTLYNIVSILKAVAASQPNIRTTTDGSVYDALNTNPAIQYDVFHISQTNHREDENYDYYGFNLFYISRLEDSLEDNRLQIQSIGKEVLSNIIRTFSENFGIDYPTITYFPFTQRFNDLCAGVYCSIQLDVPKEIWCADDYVAEVVPGSGLKLQDIGITITENGLRVITADAEYDGIGEIRIETNVPQTAAVLQDKEVEYSANGSYIVNPDPAYDGMSSVSVDVLVPDNYDEGYADGKEDGKNEQKAKLTVTSFTENNTYTREDGWSAVTVNVPATEDRYDEGYADGEAAQKAKMVATAITENGAYGRPDGYSAITVNVPSNYQDGYDDGVEDQKGKLTTLSVNENGIYTREDGWSAITVNVPQTGSSNEDLIANLQGDYFLIPDGTTHLRNYAFYGACFSSITIPTSVSAIGDNAFTYNGCLTSITIPDSVLTLGIYAFQSCRNLETVILSNSLTTLRNSLFNNCRSLTGITIPSGITSIEALCFNNCSGLTEMTFEGLVPPTINTGNSLGSTAYTFPIYVPCESIDVYKAAFGTAYAPRIQCIEPPQPTGDTAITAITLVVASAITDSGTATTTYSPTGVPTDIHYTSSDPSIATIDSGTGVITVISSGTVTICAIDDISGLQDCKQISVTKTPTSGAITTQYSVTATSDPTWIMWLRNASLPEAVAGIESIKIGDTTYPISAVTGSTASANGFTKQYVVSPTHPEERTLVGITYSFGATGIKNVIYNIQPTSSLITDNGDAFYVVIGGRDTSSGSLRSGGYVINASTSDNIKHIPEMLFNANNHLSSVTLGSGTTTIGDFAFSNNTIISNLIIPSGVTYIGSRILYNTSGRTITMTSLTPPAIDAWAFDTEQVAETPTGTPVCKNNIKVPAAALNTYKTAENWSTYADRITAITN